jgi:maleylpyruvate isomerase
VLLTQSLAIIEYLDEIHPQAPLLPPDAATRAWVRAFVLAVLAETHALVTPRVVNHLATMPGFDEATAPAWRRHWMEEGIDALEALLARWPHVEAVVVRLAELPAFRDNAQR